MATSTRASASSPASISPVGPPPTITTAWDSFMHPRSQTSSIVGSLCRRASLERLQWEVARDEPAASLSWRPRAAGGHEPRELRRAIDMGSAGQKPGLPTAELHRRDRGGSRADREIDRPKDV